MSEGELSARSDEAMIPCTFSQSVLQQMRNGGGEVHGSSAGTENPLRSLLASFVSGQSDDEDDNSQQPGSQAEEAQRLWWWQKEEGHISPRWWGLGVQNQQRQS